MLLRSHFKRSKKNIFKKKKYEKLEENYFSMDMVDFIFLLFIYIQRMNHLKNI